jgi:hypothetical protein
MDVKEFELVVLAAASACLWSAALIYEQPLAAGTFAALTCSTIVIGVLRRQP